MSRPSRAKPSARVGSRPALSSDSMYPAGRLELRPLTGLRGIAAVWIVVYHFFPTWRTLIPLDAAAPLAGTGWLAVDLFFVLSGFILSYVHDEPVNWHNYRRFLWLRIARIYPNHIAIFGALAIALVASSILHLHFTGDYALAAIPFQLTLTHAWPLAIGKWSWNYPSWSISAEWFAYMIFPITVVVRRRMNATAATGLALVLLGIWSVIGSGGFGQYAILQISLEFMAGCAIFAIYSSLGGLPRIAGAVCIAAVFGAQFAGHFAFALLVLLFPIVILSLTSESTIPGWLLSRRPSIWLGRVSYAVYMSHALSQKLLKFLIPAEHFVTASLQIRIAVIAAQLAVIFAVASLLYYGIELPTRVWIRRLGSRHGISGDRPYAADPVPRNLSHIDGATK